EPARFDQGCEVGGGALIGHGRDAFDLTLGKFGFEMSAASQLIALEVYPGRGGLRRDIRSAKWPTGAGGKIEAQVQALRLAGGMGQHFHPTRRKVIDEAG